LPERHPYRDEHPEWFVQTEFGTDGATYTWAFDHANQSWQDFVAEVLRHYVIEYDVDGFRVDAITWNDFPNWAEGLPYRCSASTYGSTSLWERITKELKDIKPDIVFYTETTGPLFMPSFDLVYNYDMQWLFPALAPPISRRGFAHRSFDAASRIQAKDLGPWLEQHRLARPEGATTVQHLDSHDTNEWGALGQYRKEAFGLPAARAMFAFCCSIDGPVMMFMGAEEGEEGFYRKMLSLLSGTPALAQGVCDYAAVKASHPDVFVVLRRHETQVVVPVISFADREVHTTIDLSDLLSGDILKGNDHYQIFDHARGAEVMSPTGMAWSASDLAELPLQLTAYQFCFLEIIPV
jgi:hypothetical protein